MEAQKWLKEHEDLNYDPQLISLVPLKSLEKYGGSLYIGGLSAYAQAETLKFDVVISLCSIPSTLDVPVHRKYSVRDEISPVEVAKMKKIISETDVLIAKSLRRGKKVLVHCAEGMSRSATVVLAYLIRYHCPTVFLKSDDTKLLRCVRFLHKCRPCIFPNAAFMEMLNNLN